MKERLLRRALALAVLAAMLACTALQGLAAYPMPVATTYPDESVYLFDLDTGKTILEQNADQPRYVASLTKMMTALLYLESGLDLQQAVTVPTSLTQEFTDIQNANGSTMGLRIGETVRRIDLLYGVIVASANDAASAVASDMAAGDLTAFVSQMNQRAAELGCTDTTFSCVHGLYDYGNVSTARDLAKIAAACYAQPQYMEAAQTVSYVMPVTNLHKNERELSSTNLMLHPDYPYYRDYIRGMKTGFTTLAGRCFVAFAEQDGHTYGLVVLGSDLDNIYRECAEMLDWVFGTFGDRQLVDTAAALAAVPLTQCRAEPEAELYAAHTVTGYGHPEDEVTFTFDLPESVRATVEEGQVVGTATVWLDGYEVGKVDLVTHRAYVSDFYTDGVATLMLLPALLAILLALALVTVLTGGGPGLFRRRHRRGSHGRRR